jgi:hypothetical protein
MDRNKIFRKINLGLWIAFAVFVFLGKLFLGVGLVFTLTGLLSITACYYNTEPLGLSIGGFDYGMRALLKEYYNRYFNLFWGLIQLGLGIGALYKILN